MARPSIVDKEAKYIFYEIIARSPRERTNNFNENSGAEFRGKSDISCYVQSNASLPRRDNASPHTLYNSGPRASFRGRRRRLRRRICVYTRR